jgi:hypothetical protein
MVALAAGASGRRTKISPQTKITTVMLVSVPKLVESSESIVIQGRRPDSMGERRCGRMRTAANTIVIT